MFHKGQKLRCINTIQATRLQMGKIYTFKGFLRDDGERDHPRLVYVEEINDGIEDAFFDYRFEPAKISNHERVKKRMEELNV